MDLLISIFNVVAFKVEIPQSYGIYHLICVALVLAAAALMVYFLKDWSDSNVRKMACGLWIGLVAMEIIKQLIFSLYVEDGALIWDYAWFIFPFQFCSSPLYILPFVAFLKDGRLRDFAISFMATFSVFAGICVYVFPNDVYCQFGIINVQTMIHHGVQIFFGFYLGFRYRDRMNIKNLLGGTAIFSVLVAVAMLLNVVVYNYLTSNGMGDTFNMFFVSPYFDCTLPVLSIVHDLVPYPVFLVIYIIGFMLCAGLIMLITKGLIMLTKYGEEKVSE